MEPSQGSMFSVEDSRARTYPWLETVLVWLEIDQDFSSSSCVSLVRLLPTGWSSRTSLAFSRRTKDGTWERSSEPWPTSGMGGRFGCLTLSTSEWPKDAAVCLLSGILEDSGRVPQRFYLSPKACAGILRRAEKRGKKLPAQFEHALRAVSERKTP